MAMDSLVAENLRRALDKLDVGAASLEDLASQLVWRIGRTSEEGPVTIRLGFAASATLFAELPRLRSASDTELEAAVREGDMRVEWVGQRPK